MRGNLRSDARSQRPPTAGLCSFLKLLRDWCCRSVQCAGCRLTEGSDAGWPGLDSIIMITAARSLPVIFQKFICPFYHELTFPPSALEPRVARVVPDERPLSSVRGQTQPPGPGQARPGPVLVLSRAGMVTQRVFSLQWVSDLRPESSRQWHLTSDMDNK